MSSTPLAARLPPAGRSPDDQVTRVVPSLSVMIVLGSMQVGEVVPIASRPLVGYSSTWFPGISLVGASVVLSCPTS